MNQPDKLNKKLDSAAEKKVVQIAARSFFDEMVKYGFDEKDIINFTTEILDLLLRKDRSREPSSTSAPRIYPVEYREDSGGKICEILGPQLSLKPLGREDLPVLQCWRDAETYRGTLIERIFDMGTEKIYEHFSSDLNRFYLVCLREGKPLGFLTYRMDWADQSRAEMQKFLADREQRGRGFGSQMTYLWLHYGFTKLHLRKISAKMVDSNLVNINLNRKLGFRFEGHLKEEVRLRDSFMDVSVMSVLREKVLDLFGLTGEA